MTLSIVVFNAYEEFIDFLDPQLCDVKETETVHGLKSIDFEYKFTDLNNEKYVQKLFRIGNKIWINDDENENITDCLYVINTDVEEDVYQKNSFTFKAEEVLVELNNAPLVSHTELSKSCFKTSTVNGELTVRVDWNSLDYWFGDYFNIGVVQDCLSTYVSYVPFTGTMTRMSLLRHIEEQTGNIFVTRYEKDCLTNEIHKYLDFLNPINTQKNWSLNLEYTFLGVMESTFYDSNGNETNEDQPWNVTRFINSNITAESLTEESTTIDESHYVEDSSYKWIAEDETVVDESIIKYYTKYSDIVAENIIFRIVDSNLDDMSLSWDAIDAARDTNFNNGNGTWLISLVQNGNKIGLDINQISYAIATAGTDNVEKWSSHVKDGSLNPVLLDENIVLPDDCYFEIYDSEYDQVLFRTCINNRIGTVHQEVLDFGFNLENIQCTVDEGSTYNAVSPVLGLNENTDGANALTRSNLTDIINRYTNLKISKGQTIPMILEKIQVQARTLEAAKTSLGSYVEGSGAKWSKKSNGDIDTANYWIRPYHPQDQKNDSDASQNTWEFWRATAYWKAPYAKAAGVLYVETDKGYDTQYSEIIGRKDIRNDKGPVHSPKMGTTESSDEDIFAIYNQVALYLKDHETPNFELEADIANLRGYEFNNYRVYDKVYIKLPDSNEIVSAMVSETTKELHDMVKNTVKLVNYTPVNNVKTSLQETVLHASNTSFKYPNSKTLQIRLENLDYNLNPSENTQYPANKLITASLYKVDNGSSTFAGKTYTKFTNATGYVSIKMKYDPGDYILDINFGGDEEYLESSISIKINVGGKKQEKTTNKSITKSKTTKKTNQSSKTTYYDKYGRSPDKKKILAIGKPSASGDQGAYAFFGMEFKNHCPKCGKDGTLAWGIFWAGNEHSNYGRFPLTGNGEGSSAEGAIFCTNQKCDGDFSCQGHEHGYTNKKLTVTKKRFKSSKSDAYKLKKGKYVYNQKSTSNSSKNVGNSKNRKVVGKINSKVKNQALSIVGDKTGYSAMKAIVAWMDKNIWYAGYPNFCRSAVTVLNKKHGNCCDGTRLFLELCDAAGLTEYYKLYYCHVYGHVYAIVQSRKTGKKTYVDCASDYHTAWGYVCQGYAHGSPTSQYPKLPF